MAQTRQKLAETLRQAAESARRLSVTEREVPQAVWTRWSEAVAGPVNESFGWRSTQIESQASPNCYGAWLTIMIQATKAASRGRNELFLLLEEDPARQLVELRRILDADGFGHNITGHLASVDGQTGYGATISW